LENAGEICIFVGYISELSFTKKPISMIFMKIFNIKLYITKLVIILIVIISGNLKAQNKFGFSLSGGILQFDRFNDYGYTGSETWYFSQAIKSEIELYYNFITKSKVNMDFGIGLAHTYFIDTGFFFPIDEKTNSVFAKLNTKYFLGKTNFYALGSLKLYYVPPLFRRYYKQKYFFESFEFGCGYKFYNNFFLNIKIASNISSPYYNDRLTRPFGTVIDPNLEFNGILIGIAINIF